MSQAPNPLADPLLTANIYCADRLDEVIYRCVAPFWRGLRARDLEPGAYLWLVRYPRGGEHLKLRVHAPEELLPLLRPSLEAAVSEHLAALGARAIPPARQDRDKGPPIDLEDEAPEGHPDRSFLWTHYRRSPVLLGGKPFCEDEGYAARFTRCLGAACEQTLAVIQPDARGDVPFRVRQIALFKAAISGLAGLGWSPERRAAYFAYHRNWLLRFFLARGRRGPEAAPEVLARFDGNLPNLGPALDALQKTADAQWLRSAAIGPRAQGADDPWRAALIELSQYLGPFAAQQGYQIDPFTDDPVFPALFKVLHGVANQLGLKPSDEAFAHHLLLHLSAGEQRHGFTHEPPAPPPPPRVEP